jgi:hypothetical protein
MTTMRTGIRFRFFLLPFGKGKSSFPPLSKSKSCFPLFSRGKSFLTVKASKEVISGETATVVVTVRNHGTRPENIQVFLRDEAGNQIDPRQEARVELASSYNFTFEWDTSDIPLGEHQLAAELNRLPDEISLADNSKTVTITIVSESSRTMYVKDIQIKTYKGFIAWSAVATVTVVSGEGNPVEGAWVFGSWSGPVGWPDFAFTDMDGVATLYSGPIFGAGEVNFTVHSVSKAGWRYKSETTIPNVPDNPDGETLSVDSQGKQAVAWGGLKDGNGKPLPTSTEFYENCPNPFNPDTWIPHQLAEDAEVVINIYNIVGRLVRTLDLGFKRAGFYVERDAAAYWDGRDDSGEKVSSGIYFYSVKTSMGGSQTHPYTITRKMTVIE